MNILFSLCYWAFVAATSILLYPGAVLIWILTAPFDPARSLLHRYTCWWAHLYLRCLPTGEMQRFYGGAFRLAAECGCAVIPIVLEGTGKVYRDWRLASPGPIHIQVLDPITLAEAGGTADGLRQQSYHRISRTLMAMRNRDDTEQSGLSTDLASAPV